MRDLKKNCDLLAAYETGLLDQDERRSFEEHLPDCPECLEEMYAMAPVMGELNADPGRYRRQLEKSLPRPSLWNRLVETFSWGPARILVPLAAAAILAFAVFMPQSPESDFPGLALTDAPAYTIIDVRAGQMDEWLPLWESGMQSYQDADYGSAAGDLTHAVTGLESTVEVQPDRRHVLDNARFYLGASQLLAGRTSQAIHTLEESSASRLMPVRQKSLWYLAQARLLADDPQAAIAALEQLQGSPVFGAKAREQIEAINGALTRPE